MSKCHHRGGHGGGAAAAATVIHILLPTPQGHSGSLLWASEQFEMQKFSAYVIYVFIFLIFKSNVYVK